MSTRDLTQLADHAEQMLTHTEGDTMATIYVEIDGQPKPISQCSWVQIAPCGCTCSVLSAGGHNNIPPLADEQQMLDFYDTPKWQQKEDADNGFRYELLDRHQAVEQLRADCPHIPKWGVEPRPELDGMKWATILRRGHRRWHLVPAAAVFGLEQHQHIRDVTKDAEALCGKSEYVWHTDEYADLPSCKNCVKAARDRLPAALELTTT